jgi:predicted transposase/invertase (TIGR01784 family)
LLALDTLTIHKNSFIDTNYYASEADVLYSARLLGTELDTRAYFYALLENQGLNHQMMPFRLTDYQVQGSKQHLKQHPGSRLPIFYSMVLYTGKAPWNSPRTLAELYSPYEKLANLDSKPYQLIDLKQFSAEELKRQGVVGFIEFALQCRKYWDDMERFCTDFVVWLHELWNHFELNFRKMLLYYMACGIPDLPGEQARIYLENTLRQLPPEFRREVMGIVDYVENQVFEQGRQQNACEIAQQMLRKGFDRAVIQELTHLSNDELEELI